MPLEIIVQIGSGGRARDPLQLQGGGGAPSLFPNPPPPYWALGAGPTKVTPHAHSKHHKCTAPPPPPLWGKCCTYRFKPPSP